MLGLGIWEILIILITALVVLGPDKLPQTARQLARLLGELRRVSDDVRRNFDDVMAEPVDPRRPDAPRPLPLGALAAHTGAAPDVTGDAAHGALSRTQDGAQTASQPKTPHNGAQAAQAAAAMPIKDAEVVTSSAAPPERP